MAVQNLTKYSLFQRSGIYWITMVIRGKRVRRSLGTRSETIAEERAEAFASQVAFGSDSTMPLRSAIDIEAWCRDVATAPEYRAHWLYSLFLSAKHRARRRHLRFDLDFANLKTAAIRCAGRCEVTGVPLEVSALRSARAHPFQPSIDRRNASDGYTARNVRIVCYSANLAMSQWGEGPLLTMLTHLSRKVSGDMHATIRTQSA